MVSAVAAEKHGQSFSFLDVDNDGYLQRADFEAIAERLARGAGSAKHEIVRDAYLKFWEGLATELGAGALGRISRQEYIEGLDRLAKSTPAAFEQTIAQMPRAILAIYDHDGDGRLSKEEFLAMQAALGVSSDKADIALLALDRDADGMIDGEELMAACREFVLSDDLHAPGNWLHGGLEPKPIRYF